MSNMDLDTIMEDQDKQVEDAVTPEPRYASFEERRQDNQRREEDLYQQRKEEPTLADIMEDVKLYHTERKELPKAVADREACWKEGLALIQRKNPKLLSMMDRAQHLAAKNDAGARNYNAMLTFCQERFIIGSWKDETDPKHRAELREQALVEELVWLVVWFFSGDSGLTKKGCAFDKLPMKVYRHCFCTADCKHKKQQTQASKFIHELANRWYDRSIYCEEVPINFRDTDVVLATKVRRGRVPQRTLEPDRLPASTFNTAMHAFVDRFCYKGDWKTMPSADGDGEDALILLATFQFTDRKMAEKYPFTMAKCNEY